MTKDDNELQLENRPNDKTIKAIMDARKKNGIRLIL